MDSGGMHGLVGIGAGANTGVQLGDDKFLGTNTALQDGAMSATLAAMPSAVKRVRGARGSGSRNRGSRRGTVSGASVASSDSVDSLGDWACGLLATDEPGGGGAGIGGSGKGRDSTDSFGQYIDTFMATMSSADVLRGATMDSGLPRSSAWSFGADPLGSGAAPATGDATARTSFSLSSILDGIPATTGSDAGLRLSQQMFHGQAAGKGVPVPSPGGGDTPNVDKGTARLDVYDWDTLKDLDELMSDDTTGGGGIGFAGAVIRVEPRMPWWCS